MNKKRLLGIILSIVLVLGLTPMVCMTARAAWIGEGDGSASAPYKISTKAELEKFRDIVNGLNDETQNEYACAVLTADIDLEGVPDNPSTWWTPIGVNQNSFSGVFDGQGHTIRNLYVKLTDESVNGGLFSLSHGIIKNLSVSGYVSGVKVAGGIVGNIDGDGGRIENCRADVTVEASTSTNNSVTAGGIVGSVNPLNSSNSSNYVIISNCSSSGIISASTTGSGNAYAGGIFGVGRYLSVTYCYSESNVTATKNSDVTRTGGIAGYSENAITSCYYNTTTAGDSVAKAVGNSADTETVKGLTADECKDKSKFIGFDFINNWFMGTSGPKLWANVSTWSDLYSALRTNGNGVKLTADVTYGTGGGPNQNTKLEIPAGVTVTLDLAGYTVDRHAGGTAVSYGYVINVNGDLTLNDSGTTGKLTGGNTTGNGGGVCVNGTFTMNGGTITGNSARSYGGGVCVNGTFTMNGGTITGNSAGLYGGGVYIENPQILQVSGSATVTGNKKVVETAKIVNNIYLKNKPITVVGALTGSIGVTMNNTPGVFTSELFGKGTEANFTSDDAAYAVGLTEAGEATLGYAVTLTAGAGMTKTSGDAAQFILPDGIMDAVVYSANDGYYFPTDYPSLGTTTGITVVRDSDTQITVSGTPKASATLTLAGATAKSKPSPTPVTPSASVKTAPVANTITYSEGPQELVTAGEAKGGTMQYALGKSKSSIPTSGWSESIPTGTDAGTYFVWYKAKGDSSHTNSVPKCVTVTIEKITSSVTTEPTVEIKTLISSGELQELITAGEAAGGTMQYAVGTSETTAPDDGWSTEIPTATDPGAYYIWYKVVGDNNHEDSEPSYAGMATIIENHSDNVLAIYEERGIATVKDDVLGDTAEVPLYVITEGLIYRMYDPNRGEHFYTKDPKEAELLVKLGWIHESDSDFTVVCATDEGAIPVYRLYNPNFGGMHFYTTDADDAKYLMSLGWNYEGISHYVYTASSTKGTPQHRLYNPNSPSGEHNWTSDEAEVDMLIAAGWIYEGICWRVE